MPADGSKERELLHWDCDVARTYTGLLSRAASGELAGRKLMVNDTQESELRDEESEPGPIQESLRADQKN